MTAELPLNALFGDVLLQVSNAVKQDLKQKQGKHTRSNWALFFANILLKSLDTSNKRFTITDVKWMRMRSDSYCTTVSRKTPPFYFCY
jgi:hypothetical protein